MTEWQGHEGNVYTPISLDDSNQIMLYDIYL